jgi:hypothetical protein
MHYKHFISVRTAMMFISVAIETVGGNLSLKIKSRAHLCKIKPLPMFINRI